MHEGEVSARLGLAGIPSISESTAIARDAAIAGYEDARVHVQHVSARESVAAVAAAKAAGVRISAEACPHHLVLSDEDVLATLDTRLKMNPPLRAPADRAAVIAGLRDGTLDCVATDHAPHAREEKEVPWEEAAMGTTGLETAFAALHTALVLPGVLPLGLVVERMSAGAALFGLPTPAIAVGAPANLALVDLAAEWEVGEAGYESRSENCCFAGRTLRGRVLATVAAGAVVHRDRTIALQLTSSARLRTPGGRDALRRRGVRGARAVTGEVVFTTGMTGYQESVTDPSFARQIIVFTHPHIGNYGVSDRAMESGHVHAAGVVMRAAVNADDAPGAQAGWLDWLAGRGVPGITGVDTRALVRHIRDAGAMRGGIFGAEVPESEARERVAAEPSMVGRDLAREVTPAAPVRFEGEGDGPRIVALDTGIKRSIVRNFTERGVTLELYPCTTSAADLLAADPDGYFLVPGPGDPAALDYLVDTIRALVVRKPVFGICLGHQLLCRAAGLETFKLRFGHRGANHPVKDVRTGRIAITSQNHGFAVAGRRGSASSPTSGPRS